MDILFKWFSYMNTVSKITYILSGIILAILCTAYFVNERKQKSERPEKGKDGEIDGKKSSP